MNDDLKFSGVNPVIVNSNGSAEDIYAPISTKSCDISIVSDQILDDLYTPQKDGIWVEISKRIPARERVVYKDDPGSARSLFISYWDPEDKQRVSSNLGKFYTDINGDFRYQGDIEGYLDGANPESNQNLVYYKTIDKWVRQDDWDLEDDHGKYFHDATDSYKIADLGSYFIYKWENGAWGSPHSYTSTDIEPDRVYTYTTGVTEYLKSSDSGNTLRYLWDASNMTFRWIAGYQYTDGPITRYDMGTPMKMKNAEGNWIDICELTYWISSQSYTKIVKLNRSAGTFATICTPPDTGGYDFFTYEDGSLYCLKNYDGTIYYWSWEAGEWIQFIRIDSDYGTQSDSFGVDYVINGEIVVCKCQIRNSSNHQLQTKFFYLTDLVHPEIKVRYDIIPGQYSTTPVFYGYMVPNTYSQPVTQNLDQIAVTAIDCLSILKYVTIDKLFNKPAVMTYGEILSIALGYVIPQEHLWAGEVILYVENCITYGGEFDLYNGLMDMRIQIANFWDESDKPSTAYEMIEEMLKPFCMRLVFEQGIPYIYNINNTTQNERNFIAYRYSIEGDFLSISTNFDSPLNPEMYEHGEDWISNNESDATIEINNTYDKVTGTASTCVPSFSEMAMDMVDYSEREKYNAGWGNVQVNKTKGYLKENVIITIRPGQSHPATIVRKDNDDHWYYIWNGVYVNPDYDLIPDSYDPHNPDVEWWRNINKYYEYMTGTTTGYNNDFGQMLTFQGGGNNPTGTGKVQMQEKSVEIKKRITAYAPDNGVPPEFYETSDLAWTFNYNYNTNYLHKLTPAAGRYGGTAHMAGSTRCVYKQVYENVSLSSVEDQVVDINLTQSYSRTGIDTKINVMNNNTATNKQMVSGSTMLNHCDTNFFPAAWNAENIKVDSFYFRRYASESGDATASCLPLWDERYIKLYVEFSDGTFQMFNGKDWVTDGENHSHPFIMTKMITGEQLFHNDMKYNCVRCPSDPITIRYSLTGEDIYIYYDNDGGVTDRETRNYTLCHPYNSEENSWYHWIANCGEGQVSIRLPYVDDPAAKVYVEVWNSSILGMNGQDGPVTAAAVDHTEPFYYTLDDTYESTTNFKEVQVYMDFLPTNLTYIKAEHLDLSITISVPESNLGQMFSQSDIQYEIKSGRNYEEEYSGPSFQVNTKNQLVASSYSYLMFNREVADPDNFIINGISTRPECYTVQAYYNWLTKIRKIYNKTLLPVSEKDRPFGNIMTFIQSPEIGENPLMVISDSWDLKTDRHSITSIECQDLDVYYIDPFMVNELPRKARAERWNLPTSTKRK